MILYIESGLLKVNASKGSKKSTELGVKLGTDTSIS